GKIPVIGANGIAAYHDEAKMKGPGVAIGRSGTLGKVYYIEGDYWPLNTCLYVKEFRSVNPKFIFYFLHMIDYEKYNAGSTVPTMNRNFLHPVRVVIPRAVEEQKKIASIISKVDYLIQKTDKIIGQTQSLKKGLIQHLITKGIGYTEYKQSEIRTFPTRWNVLLKDIASIRTKSDSIESKLYIGLEHIGQGTNRLESRGNVNDFTSTKNVFLKGDILYGKLRPLLNKVWLATENGYCSTDILPIIPNERVLGIILMYILSSPRFVAHATSTPSGTKMP
ncbi:MAG TPA: restriction endonuclease subunit S, partial [Nitrososphaeraceae archaeon]|nr:restriction endonuclease subunit S [Nitrososphaeraceae archaeon]